MSETSPRKRATEISVRVSSSNNINSEQFRTAVKILAKGALRITNQSISKNKSVNIT